MRADVIQNRTTPTVRSPLLHGLLWLALLAPGPVLAQGATPPGSLTVLSRPAGAACRISGDRMVVGRTPLTLERGLTGRYRVRAVEPGYERWERSILLDGASADTLWMTLRAKNAFKAGIRSLLIPGWGQFYSERPELGWTFFGAGLAAAGGAVATHLEYRNRLDDVDAAVSLAERQRAVDRANDAFDTRQIVLGVAAGVWALNFLDAVAFFPDLRTGPVTVGFDARTGADGAPGAALAVKAGF